MKALSTVVMAVSMLALSAFLSPARASDVLQNGNMDAGTSNWVLGMGSVTPVNLADGQHNNVLEVVDTQPPIADNPLFCQYIGFNGGVRYKVQASFYAKNAPVTLQLVMRRQVNISTWYYKGASTFTIPADGQWHTCSITSGSDINITGIVGFLMKTTGDLYVDDFKMDKAPATGNLISSEVPGKIIPKNYFGFHINSWGTIGSTWPNINSGMLRLWDATAPNPVTWQYVEPGYLAWWPNGLDTFTNAASTHGNEVIYTLGQTPSWASSDPTLLPSNSQLWLDYIHWIDTNYAGRIQYLEMWNEPDYYGFYNNDAAALAWYTVLTRIQLNADHSTMKLLGPGATDNGPKWLDDYLCAVHDQEIGNGLAVNSALDGICFHHYFSPTPEDTLPVIAGFKSIFANHGYNVSTKKFFETESSCDPPSGTSLTSDQLVAAIARAYVLQWSQGVQNVDYYTWDIHTPLCDPTNKSQPNAGGVSYNTTSNWMVGATMGVLNYNSSNGIWYAKLTDASGWTGYIVWLNSGSYPLANINGLPDFAGSNYYEELDGSGPKAFQVSGGTSGWFPLSYKPVLLESGMRDPSPLTATQGTVGSKTITTKWKAVSGATGYKVYRSTSATGTYTQVGTTTTNLSFPNTGLTAGTTYYYKTAAVKSTITGVMSNSASAQAR